MNTKPVKSHLYVATLLPVIAFSTGACGFIFSHAPPEGHEQMNSFSCTESNAAPILDIVWGGLNVLGALSAIADPDNIRANTDYEPGTIVAIGLGWGVLSGSAAAVGFNKSKKCREAKRALGERLQRGDGSSHSDVAWIRVSPSNYELETIGEQVQLSATAFGSRNEIVPDKTFRWTSSDLDVASVNAIGLVTARSTGSVVIVASTDDATWMATVRVRLER